MKLARECEYKREIIERKYMSTNMLGRGSLYEEIGIICVGMCNDKVVRAYCPNLIGLHNQEIRCLNPPTPVWLNSK